MIRPALSREFEPGGLAGHLDCTYADLVRTFGEPHMTATGFNKTDAEWELVGSTGFFTIYNYKNGPAYLGPEETPIENITEWNVGGRSASVREAQQAIERNRQLRLA